MGQWVNFKAGLKLFITADIHVPNTAQHFKVCKNKEIRTVTKIVCSTAIFVTDQCANSAEKIISRVRHLRTMQFSFTNNENEIKISAEKCKIHPSKTLDIQRSFMFKMLYIAESPGTYISRLRNYLF